MHTVKQFRFDKHHFCYTIKLIPGCDHSKNGIFCAVRWRISGYAVSPTDSVIDRWLDEATDQASAKFGQRLRFLRSRPASQWHTDYAHQLKDAERIFEIKFEANKVAHRPLCMFGPSAQQFTILNFAVEHNNSWRPPGALETAKQRKQEVEAGASEIIDYDED